MTKLHTEELIQKYDMLIRKQEETYEALIAVECEKAAEKKAAQMELSFMKDLEKAKKKWNKKFKSSLDEERQELIDLDFFFLIIYWFNVLISAKQE